ncbi:MAG: DoxX family protein [Flavobacterium sp.]|nr:DoxX family protein [Flavobacterium sp.]
MKIFLFIIRSLTGLLLLFAAITYFFPQLIEQPAPEGTMKTFGEGLAATVYLMPFVKSLELICGLSYITGRYVTLTNLILLPISVNILLINWFMMPFTPVFAMPALLFIGNVVMIYRYWDNYKQLFTAR